MRLGGPPDVVEADVLEFVSEDRALDVGRLTQQGIVDFDRPRAPDSPEKDAWQMSDNSRFMTKVDYL